MATRIRGHYSISIRKASRSTLLRLASVRFPALFFPAVFPLRSTVIEYRVDISAIRDVHLEIVLGYARPVAHDVGALHHLPLPGRAGEPPMKATSWRLARFGKWMSVRQNPHRVVGTQ